MPPSLSLTHTQKMNKINSNLYFHIEDRIEFYIKNFLVMFTSY